FFAAPKALRDLKDTLVSVGEQPLHLILGRRDQIPRARRGVRLERVEVQIEPRRRHEQGRLDLEEPARLEEAPDRADRARAPREELDGESPRKITSANSPDARASPPGSAFPSAHVSTIPSSAPNVARATTIGCTSLRKSPAACPSDTTFAITSRYALNF